MRHRNAYLRLTEAVVLLRLRGLLVSRSGWYGGLVCVGGYCPWRRCGRCGRCRAMAAMDKACCGPGRRIKGAAAVGVCRIPNAGGRVCLPPVALPASAFLFATIVPFPAQLLRIARSSTPSTMPPAASSVSSFLKGAWRPTKIMNMRDLSRDDDFLSHLLVEKLGTGGFPLVVHKMDPSRRLPKSDPEELMNIVRRVSLPVLSCLL